MNETNLFTFKVKYLNKKEFHLIKDENFKDHIYEFKSSKKSPVIFDIGAHIGISTLYFKTLYPNACIYAFEPNPELYEVLKENMLINGLEDVQLHNIAISKKEGDALLYIDKSEDKWHSNSSLIKGGWTKREVLVPVTVHCEHLSKFITSPIDMLKIDVEGTELSIIEEIEEKLPFIHNIAIEFHPGQKIEKIARILSSCGFHIHYNQSGKYTLNPDTNNLFIIHGIRNLN